MKQQDAAGLWGGLQLALPISARGEMASRPTRQNSTYPFVILGRARSEATRADPRIHAVTFERHNGAEF